MDQRKSEVCLQVHEISRNLILAQRSTKFILSFEVSVRSRRLLVMTLIGQFVPSLNARLRVTISYGYTHANHGKQT